MTASPFQIAAIVERGIPDILCRLNAFRFCLPASALISAARAAATRRSLVPAMWLLIPEKFALRQLAGVNGERNPIGYDTPRVFLGACASSPCVEVFPMCGTPLTTPEA